MIIGLLVAGELAPSWVVQPPNLSMFSSDFSPSHGWKRVQLGLHREPQAHTVLVVEPVLMSCSLWDDYCDQASQLGLSLSLSGRRHLADGMSVSMVIHGLACEQSDLELQQSELLVVDHSQRSDTS